jgi:hypothetical protein
MVKLAQEDFGESSNVIFDLNILPSDYNDESRKFQTIKPFLELTLFGEVFIF